MPHLRPFLVLCRISNLPTVWSNVLAAWFLSGQPMGSGLFLACLAGSLCYLGGMILNDVFDVDWDREHQKARPIPQGDISQRTATWLGGGFLGAGLVLFLLLQASPLMVFALGASILAYNAFHKKWKGAYWIMGACRLFLFLTPSSIPSQPSLELWFAGLLLLLFVAGITLAARGEASHQEVPGFAFTLLYAPCLSLLVVGNREYTLVAVLLLLLWIRGVHHFLQTGKLSVSGFVGCLLAGMVIVDAISLSHLHPILPPLICLLFLPLNLFLQRFIPAT